MTVDTKKMREDAMAWLSRSDLTRVTRENAVGEELLALDVVDACEEIERMRKQLDAARAAARAFVAYVDDLGAFADDSDPRVMATAGPLGATQADLWTALGLDHGEEHARLQADIESRCAVCGWTLRGGRLEGCVRGNCSMRPRPEKLYAPQRAAREEAELRKAGAK